MHTGSSRIIAKRSGSSPAHSLRMPAPATAIAAELGELVEMRGVLRALLRQLDSRVSVQPNDPPPVSLRLLLLDPLRWRDLLPPRPSTPCLPHAVAAAKAVELPLLLPCCCSCEPADCGAGCAAGCLPGGAGAKGVPLAGSHTRWVGGWAPGASVGATEGACNSPMYQACCSGLQGRQLLTLTPPPTLHARLQPPRRRLLRSPTSSSTASASISSASLAAAAWRACCPP